jgi:hypothetical protein
MSFRDTHPGITYIDGSKARNGYHTYHTSITNVKIFCWYTSYSQPTCFLSFTVVRTQINYVVSWFNNVARGNIFAALISKPKTPIKLHLRWFYVLPTLLFWKTGFVAIDFNISLIWLLSLIFDIKMCVGGRVNSISTALISVDKVDWARLAGWLIFTSCQHNYGYIDGGSQRTTFPGGHPSKY